MNDIYKHGDRLLTMQETPIFTGYLHSDIPSFSPDNLLIQYKGGKISELVWNQVKSFLQYTYNIAGGEGQIRLFYNSETCTWLAHPLEQFVSRGLSTDEKKDSDISKQVIERMLSNGYINFGTVHHHCNIGAFQSGTDYKDEITQNGFHTTLGKLDSPIYDFHSRAVFRGVCYKVTDSEWFDNLDNSKVDDTLFPPEWKNFVVEKPVVPVAVNPYVNKDVWANSYEDAWLEYYTNKSKVKEDRVVNESKPFIDEVIDYNTASDYIDECVSSKFKELGTSVYIDDLTYSVSGLIDELYLKHNINYDIDLVANFLNAYIELSADTIPYKAMDYIQNISELVNDKESNLNMYQVIRLIINTMEDINEGFADLEEIKEDEMEDIL